MGSNSMPVHLPNPHLKNLHGDALFHLDIALDDKKLVAQFQDVKFVCVGGTASRMRYLAQTLSKRLFNSDTSSDTSYDTSDDDFDFVINNCRYSAYKVGPIFCVSHGIGTPSLSIVLHEVFKLLQRAKCSDVTLIRIGTCGGIGLPAGTVVISDGALSPGFEPVYVTSRLGKPLKLPVVVDKELVDDLYNCHIQNTDEFRVVRGQTYCADDFYQAQGRLDGSFCDYDQSEQHAFFEKLYDLGVRNIEMESACVLAFAHKVGIKAAVVCVTLVNRLEADLPDAKPEVVNFPIELVTRLIKSKLGL